MRFTNPERAPARAYAPLDSVIAERVELHAENASLRGSCPLHLDERRSLYVMRIGCFHCFSCGAGGDVVDWTMLVDRVDEASAIKRLLARQPRAGE